MIFRRVMVSGALACLLAMPAGASGKSGEGDESGSGEQSASGTQSSPSDEQQAGDDKGKERDDAKRSDASPAIGGVDAQALSLQEKQRRVEESLSDLRDALRRVTDILAEARSSKDIVQLNCVNEKLTQLKGLLKISEDASVKMYDAIASGTEDVINHEFTKIVVAHQKGMALRAEAEQCVGELSVYSGDTDITVEIDEDIPENDPTTPTPPPPGPVVPPVASAF